jgi:hypothetical protein
VGAFVAIYCADLVSLDRHFITSSSYLVAQIPDISFRCVSLRSRPFFIPDDVAQLPPRLRRRVFTGSDILLTFTWPTFTADPAVIELSTGHRHLCLLSSSRAPSAPPSLAPIDSPASAFVFAEGTFGVTRPRHRHGDYDLPPPSWSMALLSRRPVLHPLRTPLRLGSPPPSSSLVPVPAWTLPFLRHCGVRPMRRRVSMEWLRVPTERQVVLWLERGQKYIAAARPGKCIMTLSGTRMVLLTPRFFL